MIEPNISCKSCGSADIWIFYEIEQVPVHSVVLLTNKHDAINFPKGDIRLGYCRKCEFISNLVFESSFLDYSFQYESTQRHSPTFSKFAQELATDLIHKYDLFDKTILEIGCGQGEFLNIISQLGNNHGIGFDPAYDPSRTPYQRNPGIKIIKDYYSEEYSHVKADFIICKMTLEHISNPRVFLSSVRKSIHPQSDPILFIQVPDVTRILKENAFWDIYYEHCSYFSPRSLSRLFHQCNFNVIALGRGFNDQYIMIEANVDPTPSPKVVETNDGTDEIDQQVIQFADTCNDLINSWRDRLINYQKNQKTVVVWGGGSKAVAFLSTVNIPEGVAYIVDINPHKHDTFLPGTGHKITKPSLIQRINPDTIIIMNSAYFPEIKAEIDLMNLKVELLTL